MCFYLALKVYILYSFFCITFSPPGRTGRASGFGTELGKQHWLHASPCTWKVLGQPPALKSSLPPHSPCPQVSFLTTHSGGATLEDIARCWG